MATSNLRARIERLEQQRQEPGGEPLIIRINRYSKPEGGYVGVSVNGTLTRCPDGECADDLELRLIGEIESRRQGGLYVVRKV